MEMVGAKGSPVSRVPCRARCRYIKGSNHVTYFPSCRFVLCSDKLFTLPLLSDPTFQIFTILIHLLSLLVIFWKSQLHYFSKLDIYIYIYIFLFFWQNFTTTGSISHIWQVFPFGFFLNYSLI